MSLELTKTRNNPALETKEREQVSRGIGPAQLAVAGEKTISAAALDAAACERRSISRQVGTK
jgi:hypothetical protein